MVRTLYEVREAYPSGAIRPRTREDIRFEIMANDYLFNLSTRNHFAK